MRALVECEALRDSITHGSDAWEAQVVAAAHALSLAERRLGSVAWPLDDDWSTRFRDVPRRKPAQFQTWLDQKFAFASVNHQNGCRLMTVGDAKARIQFLSFPHGFAEKLLGSSRVQGNMHCATFAYPGRPAQEQCREWFKVGDNKYEARVNGVATSTQYLLVK